jgi:hypothetical protein
MNSIQKAYSHNKEREKKYYRTNETKMNKDNSILLS